MHVQNACLPGIFDSRRWYFRFGPRIFGLFRSNLANPSPKPSTQLFGIKRPKSKVVDSVFIGVYRTLILSEIRGPQTDRTGMVMDLLLTNESFAL